jgi:2-methylcitrate dehydratase PrpD
VISPEPDPDQLVDGLGSTWNVLDNGHKLYPSASLTHPAIDAAHDLRSLDPSTITAIEVRLAPFAADVTALRHPGTGTQARFTTAHCVAVALLHGAVRPEHFTDGSAADPEVRALRDTVTVVSDTATAKRGWCSRPIRSSGDAPQTPCSSSAGLSTR